MSDQNTTITATALSRMLQQFEGSANLRLLASSYTDQAQAFEDAAWPLLGERGIDNATGDRLDRIGAVVKTMRSGRADAAYRQALKARMAVLQSTGTEADLLTITDLLVQMGTPDYDFTEYFPKGVVIRPVDNAVTRLVGRSTGTALKQGVSAGTTMHFVYSGRADSLTYTLSTQGAVVDTGTNLGLASTPALIGSWLYDASAIVLAGIASGDFRFNHADPLQATEFYVHDEDSGTTDRSTELALLLNSTLFIRRAAGSGAAITLLVTAVTDNTGTFTLDITPQDHVGGAPLDNNSYGLYDMDDGGALSGVS
ncbi:MAG: hypothetical protein OEU26_00170 [Candidatus Tectomicrobia bacterium]|nr:hypothetical protein [Candidatus Tectomicrobia bacterium]